MGDENIEIIDEDTYNYSANADLSPRTIVLRHIDRISKYIFKGEEQPTLKHNQTVTSDRRQVVIQAIQFLTSLLTPYYDKEFETKQKEIDKKIKELEEELVKKSIKETAHEKAIKYKGGFENAYKYYLDFYTKSNIHIINKSGGSYEVYMSKKFFLHLNLFTEMNKLLYRINYLTAEDYTE